MAYEIVKVSVKNVFSPSESDIERVKLSDGTIETVPQVVNFIDRSFDYYFTSSNGHKTEVETVHPSNSEPYIRTKANQTTSDNLLSLPRF
ncbi:DUF3892 domain-containing protein [Latilactobacillus fuchuensis]|uniref:DUF3892 domain-containing protein n=1 Tax=Latilactobacillus fuchuensis TaxID=164393 RepID=UPI0039B0F1ED